MSAAGIRTSRRAFFLKGGAAVGAGVAGAGTALAGDAARPDANATDREAIRLVQASFAANIEARAWEAAVALFAPQASLRLASAEVAGQPAIRQYFLQRDAVANADSFHDAYRPNARQLHDSITVDADSGLARATWHVDVRVGRPLQGDCTLAQMARLQGQLEDMHWESGVLEARYMRHEGGWVMQALVYRTG